LTQDEAKENDNKYNKNGIEFIMDKEVTEDVSIIEIDYEKQWWGEDYIITAGF